MLALIFARGALADGAYLRTDERKKTLVWNNDPKPDDAASWSGDRDRDGYATGPGTLTWFRIDHKFVTGSNIFGHQKTPISSYTGTMVHGKLSGNVTTVDHGKTYHATFADGHKKGQWIAGPYIAKAESAEPTATAEKAEPTETTTSTGVASERARARKAPEEKPQPRIAEDATADIPAEGPEKTEVSAQKPETGKSEPVQEETAATTPKLSQPLVAQASTEEPSTTPRESVTRKTALAPGAVHAIEQPARHVAKKQESSSARAVEEKTEKSPKTAKSASSEPAKLDTNLSENTPSEGPPPGTSEENAKRSTEANPAQTIQSPTAESPQPSTKETPVDDSIRALTGPPASLHLKAPPETNPPTQISTPATAAASPPAPAGPKLTAVNAMDIADIEARTKGYDLGEYELPKAEYNAASDTWLVNYVPRNADSTTKRLSVTIQDKNGKAEVKK